MRQVLFFSCLIAVASAALATQPPPLPPVLPPQTPSGPAVPVPPTRFLPPPAVVTKELFDRLPVSTSMYRSMLYAFLHRGTVPLAGASSSTFSETGVPVAVDGRASGKRFLASPFLRAPSSYAIDSDANEDVEPSTIVQRYPAGGTDYQIAAYMKFPVPNNVQGLDYVRSSIDGVNKALAFAMPPPSTVPYNFMADPVLAENPYNGGVNPKRVYCIGTMYNIYTDQQNFGLVADTTIPVWYSDNAGSSWAGPYLVKSLNRGTYVLYDKPAIAVSWNQNSLGVAYIAFVEAPTNGGGATSNIDIYRISQNGMSFEFRSQPVNSLNVQSPQLVVDPNDGNLYLLWIDVPNNTINIARSSDQGMSFPNRYSFQTVKMLTNAGFGDNIWDNTRPTPTTPVQARTTLSAVWNNYDLSVGVVWHERETYDRYAHTDIKFNRFLAYGVPSPSWDSMGPKTVNAVSTNDQWHPVLDDNENGQYTVMYYDRRADTNNISYQVYGDKIDAGGNRLEGDTLLYQYGLSNILAYTATFDVGHASRTLGEYQGLWYWYGTWYGATVYIPASTGDIYSVSIVSP